MDVKRLRKPGRYGDGWGLILDVIGKDRKNWLFRFTLAGRERWMGLGSARDVSLAEAREKAQAARALVKSGIDPIDHRNGKAQEQAAKVTFNEAAALYIAAHESAWRNRKHGQQWRNTLATYAAPVLGALAVADIEVNLVLRTLQPVWNAKPETASRVRSRIELVLDYARTRGWRNGENPARWRGNLKLLLPRKPKLQRVQHHAAVDWREAPAFMAELREHGDMMGAGALTLAILTAARSNEVRGARWAEVDLERAVWTIPGSRMKSGREHRVPLSPPALAILHAQAALQDGSGLVFAGLRFGVPMSDMTISSPLRAMGLGDLTVHGFRSTFRTWAAEATDYPSHVVEQALAHAIGSAVEKAYQRGDLFTKRTALMTEWAAFLARPPAAIVPLHTGAQKPLRRSRAVRRVA
jgi:integrase